MEKIRPVRLQLKRTKGFNLQKLSKKINGLKAVVVSRPSRWGNPFEVGKRAPEEAIQMFAIHISSYFLGFLANKNKNLKIFNEWIKPLRGKNLACWCKPSKKCHADILLDLANK